MLTWRIAFIFEKTLYRTLFKISHEWHKLVHVIFERISGIRGFYNILKKCVWQ